jgi:hypothetical protein
MAAACKHYGVLSLNSKFNEIGFNWELILQVEDSMHLTKHGSEKNWEKEGANVESLDFSQGWAQKEFAG